RNSVLVSRQYAGAASDRMQSRRHYVYVLEDDAPMKQARAPREHAGRAAPLDLEVLDLVPAVRTVRHDRLVPREGAGADQGGEAEERRRDLPHADAAGAERDELVLARQEPQADERADQHGERR